MQSDSPENSHSVFASYSTMEVSYIYRTGGHVLSHVLSQVLSQVDLQDLVLPSFFRMKILHGKSRKGEGLFSPVSEMNAFRTVFRQIGDANYCIQYYM